MNMNKNETFSPNEFSDNIAFPLSFNADGLKNIMGTYLKTSKYLRRMLKNTNVSEELIVYADQAYERVETIIDLVGQIDAIETEIAEISESVRDERINDSVSFLKMADEYL